MKTHDQDEYIGLDQDIFWRRVTHANIFALIKMSWRRLKDVFGRWSYKTSSTRRMFFNADCPKRFSLNEHPSTSKFQLTFRTPWLTEAQKLKNITFLCLKHYYSFRAMKTGSSCVQMFAVLYLGVHTFKGNSLIRYAIQWEGLNSFL